ncbi:M20/M25/M40 family metallo-hydrolase [Tetragenococcus halophilus]|mgnify:CR=1 FL=1|uniref:Peptidase M20 family protein n=3 Tax=Tetragenococcus halophilus TaxID=51669 RepID=A0AAN1SGX6_TETHN|nr:M20/M25/M40 family metallo-hydrolase [Tetragenococcus halophilus]MCF1601177.1 M20/M25/M40 family metallo-hydrolase [Tetragenococcus halophilus]MCF1675637.1 M20/M25/M40 family metallo-hydrolase [Tetragenococcus halophilus]MCO8289435.1 M20/M25/M40 family metallo-hydrolase [Tetragenococcus halophilus]MCO8290318.1 M20/M25/M40 family metallo-hydrolase [Tetragenococcus halophilus]MCO8294381.1 M20/M25/M40 family metallo-hydrolase [Tetragenococcus halophilus]
MSQISTEEIKRISDKNMARFYDYLRLESVSAQGRQINQTAEAVQSFIENTGGEAKVLALEGAHPVVYGFFAAGPSGDAEKTLLFYDHYDVQPEDPLDEWNTVPFEPTEKDGLLYARGVSDNKANFVARINAIEAYKNTEGGLPVNVKFFVEGEEEIGSPHVNDYLEAYADLFAADVCIWESSSKDSEERLKISAGVKGIAYYEARVKSADIDMHSSLAAIADNSAWRLVQALASMRNVNNEITVDGFYDMMTAPTDLEKRVANRIPFDPEASKQTYGLKHPLITDQLPYTPEEALVFYPTLTISGLLSGYTGPGAKTILPRQAMAKIDVRLVPGYEPDKVTELLRKHLDSNGFEDVALELITSVMPFRTNLEDPFVEIVIDSAKKVYGEDKVVLEPNSAGTGPMYGFGKYLNVPILGSGTEWEKSGAHAPNENIRLADFYQGVEHMVVLLDRFKNSEK